MTVFWKPVRPGRLANNEGTPWKRLGHGLYELWCRCDVCHGSNPFDRFARLSKGEFTATLCENCAGDEHLARHLMEDGWRP